MKTKVWLSLLIICSLLCTACTTTATTVEAEPPVPPMQDTLGMIPDFSYAVTPQIPNVYVDGLGYRPEDKKIAFFLGNNLEKTFDIVNLVTDEVVYSGALFKVKDLGDQELYIGDFTSLPYEGEYFIRHPQIGDSYEFSVNPSIYEQEFLVLQRSAKEYTYTNVSDAAYMLANMMFAQEIFAHTQVDFIFMKEKLEMLMNSQDKKTGAFYSEIFEEPLDLMEENETQAPEGSVSLTCTAQMAGVLAQYYYLYRESEPVFAKQCLKAGQKAYKYMAQYRGNTDTDAWYYAAVQMYRATGQYKYRNAIKEYDAMDPGVKSRTAQGYTILADFTYLSTANGTDYARCAELLEQYMGMAQEISDKSSRENFYVLSEIDMMSAAEVLDNMIVLGVVNHVLSGQEYAGIQRNYIHYLAGVNVEAKNRLYEEIIAPDSQDGEYITNIAKLMVILGNME